MASLVTTLRTHLAQADAAFRAGRVSAARRAFADLLERAQDRSDAEMIVLARAMLGWCALASRDLDEARRQLREAAARLKHDQLAAEARYRAASARLALAEGPVSLARGELRAYLRWAEEADQGEALLDAYRLLAAHSDLQERVEWLQRGVERARARGVTLGLARAAVEWAAALEAAERWEEALTAWQEAMTEHLREGDVRGQVEAGWAIGALAVRLEEWPLAREQIEETLALAERVAEGAPWVPLLLGELALVYAAAGDVIEGRRLVLRARLRGEEVDLPLSAPGRWDRLREISRSLDLD